MRKRERERERLKSGQRAVRGRQKQMPKKDSEGVWYLMIEFDESTVPYKVWVADSDNATAVETCPPPL